MRVANVTRIPENERPGAAPSGAWFDGQAVRLPDFIRGLNRPDLVPQEEWEAFKEAATVFINEFESTQQGKPRADIAYALGRILETLNNDEGALRCYQAAFKADASHRPTTDSGRRLFSRIGRWSIVLKFLEAAVRGARSRAEKGRLFREMAEIYLLRFQRLDESRVLIERALDACPNEPMYLLRGIQIMGMVGRADDLQRLCERVVHSSGKSELTPAVVALALADLLRVGATEEAVQLFLGLPRRVQTAFEVVGYGVFLGPDSLGAELYFELQKRIIWATPDPLVRGVLFRTVAAEAASRGDSGIAIEFASQAVQAHPEHGRHWGYLGELHAQQERPVEAAEAYRKSIDLETDDVARLALAHRLMRRERSTPETGSAWRCVLEQAPWDAQARWHQRQALVNAKAWSALETVLRETALVQPEPSVKAALLWATGLVVRFRLNQGQRAHSLFAAAHEVAPDCAIIGTFFQYSRQEFDSAVNTDAEQRDIAVLTDWMGEPTDIAVLATSLSDAFFECVEDGRIQPALRSILTQSRPVIRNAFALLGQPTDTDPLFADLLMELAAVSEASDVRHSLCRWSADLALRAGRIDIAQTRVDQALALREDLTTLELSLAVARKQEDVDLIAEALRGVAHAAHDPLETAERLTDLAIIGESYARYRVLVGPCLKEALRANPDAVRARRHFRHYWLGQGVLAQRFDEWRQFARTSSIPGARALDLLVGAEIARVELSSVDDGVSMIDEAEETLSGSLLPTLYFERIAYGTGTIELLNDTYAGLLRRLKEHPLRIEFALARGRVLELLGEYFLAIEAYRGVLRIDSQNPEALDWLGRSVDETGDPELLGLIQARRAELLAEHPDLGTYLVEAARTHFLNQDVLPALELAKAAVVARPRDIVALHYLQVLSQVGGDGAEARKWAIRLAEVTRADETAVDVYIATAKRAHEADDFTQAETCYLAALERGAPVDEVLDALRDNAELSQEWRAYADGLEVVLRRHSDAEHRDRQALDFLQTVARRLNDPRRALATLIEVLEGIPQPSVKLLRLVGDLAVEVEAWADAVRWLGQARLRSTDEDMRRSLGLALARLHETRLNDPGQARKELMLILDAKPDDAGALERLIEIELAAGRTSEARIALARAITAADDPEKRSALRLRQSELYLDDEQLDPEQKLVAARAGLKTALTESPASAQVYEEQEARIQRLVQECGGETELSLLNELRGESYDALLTSDDVPEVSLNPETGPLWDELNSELVTGIRGLVELLPPLFLAPPPVQAIGSSTYSRFHGEVALAPMPLMSVFRHGGDLVLSSALESHSSGMVEFLSLRARALDERGLTFAANWNGADLQVFARAIGACLGLRSSDGEQERVLFVRDALEAGLSGQTVSQESVRCVSACLEGEKRLPSIIASIRLAAARTALVQQRNIRAAYEAYSAAQEDANGVLREHRSQSIDHELTELVRWYSSNDYREYLRRWSDPSNAEKVT